MSGPVERAAILAFSSLGGSGRMAVELARQLAQRGIDVDFVCSGTPRGLSGPGDDDLPERITHVPILAPNHPVLEGPPYTMAAASALIERIEHHRVDVVHAHYAVPHAASVALLDMALGPMAPPAVVTLHGTDVTRLGREPGLAPVLRRTLERMDGLMTPSRYLADQTRRCFGPLPGLEVVPNFVDTEQYRPAAPPDRRVFDRFFPTRGSGDLLAIHVSNLRPIKRVQDALLAMAHLKGRVDGRLVVVGEGPSRDALERQAEELQLTPLVAFVGARSDVHALLPHADAFIFPSETESFGLAALESLSSGTPVVASRVGGLSEVVGDAGRLVPMGRPEAFAEGLLDVVRSPELRKRARDRAVRHFSPEPSVERTLDLYRRLVHGGRRTGSEHR